MPIAAATRRNAMSEELTPRIYREYCWFALVLLILAIGIVSRPPLGDTSSRANAAGATSVALAPTAQPTP
jgi:hypothetical protein